MEEESTTQNEKHEVTEDVSAQGNKSYQGQSDSLALGVGVGCLVWVILGIVVAAFLSDVVAQFLRKWWWAVLLGIIILECLLALPSIRKRTTTKTRVALIIFLVIPIFLVLVGGVVFIPRIYQVPVIRGIFLVIVCLLPAIMYYLFITTTKFSLLNEFIANLDRFGLLAGPKAEAASPVPSNLQRRTATYIRKFEAVYGSLPPGTNVERLKRADPSSIFDGDARDQSGTSGLAGIFTSETRIPVVLSTILVALGWLMVLVPWQGLTELNIAAAVSPASKTSHWLAAFTPERSPVHFAFLGAYFFSIQMLFRRYVRRDLRASGYVSVSLRIILAVIGAWVAVAAVNVLMENPSEESLLVIGFVIGAFPPVVWQVIQATLKKFGPAFVLPTLQPEMPLSELDGLTVWHESRLEEEDIENVPNMATADMVELMLNTRFTPDRIVDWVDQSMLYTHLGPERQTSGEPTNRQKLRAHGIRTASALVAVYEGLRSEEDRSAFGKILGEQGYSPLRSLVEALKTNPNLQMIQIWQRSR